MTDLNALAQRVVAQGIPEVCDEGMTSAEWIAYDAESFCNDGRVVLALMEKALQRCTETRMSFLDIMNSALDRWVEGSFAIAICEACCEALEHE